MDGFWAGVIVGGLGVVILLGLLRGCVRRPPPRFETVFLRPKIFLINTTTGEEKELNMATTVPPGNNVRIALTPLDADGQPTQVDIQDREIAWTSSVLEITVTPAPDGLSALVIAPQGFRGTAQIQANADADLDAGEDRSILMLADLEYVGGEAVQLQGNVTLEPR